VGVWGFDGGLNTAGVRLDGCGGYSWALEIDLEMGSGK